MTSKNTGLKWSIYAIVKDENTNAVLGVSFANVAVGTSVFISKVELLMYGKDELSSLTQPNELSNQVPDILKGQAREKIVAAATNASLTL